MDTVLYATAAVTMGLLAALLAGSALPPQGWGWRALSVVLALACLGTALYAVARIAGLA